MSYILGYFNWQGPVGPVKFSKQLEHHSEGKDKCATLTIIRDTSNDKKKVQTTSEN